MRRGQIFVILALVLAACSFGFAANARADDSGTPQAICKDLQDGKLDGTYTAAEYQAFLNDPTVQGYCGAIVPPAAPAPAPAPATPTPQTPAPPVSLAPQASSPAVAAGVQGASHTTVTKPSSVKGARHTATSRPVAASAAPLSTSKTTGSLPFTGAELALFALVGLVLIGTGLLLRTTARQRS